PTVLDHDYVVELADGRIVGVNTIIRIYTLNFLNHPFNIDLMPVEMGSFDVIIGMYWLSRYQAVIVCADNIVRIPWGRETLIFHDLSSVPLTQQVVFQIDLIPGAAPVARAPYRLNNKEHEEHLRTILKLLKKEELYAKFSKCEFWIPKVQFLGHLINNEGIHVDSPKIKSIMDWVSPKSPMEIRQFLGLVGYYRRFIKGFSKIAKPMTKLTQKKIKFEFGDKQEAAFQLLKQKLCSAPILALPEGSEDFVAYCDASIKGLGAMLMQRHYLYETKCTVFTDHTSLQHILNQKDLNLSQRHWLELLSDYDCEIRYHPGKENIVADALSRKEREPLRVRALVMTIGLDLPKQILNA
nr:putative reverse transcriptase domain-containing protein [Tanacetum cinerariifolium]